MQKQLLFTLIGLHLGGMVMAQDSLITLRRPYRTVLKFSPLSRLDPDATFQGAVEYQTGSKSSGQLEFGYGGPVLQTGGSGLLPWTGNNSVQGKEVWRVRAERRFYRHRVLLPVYQFYGQPPITQLIGSYFSIEALYKQTNVARLDTILGGETSTRSFVEAPVSRRAYALYGKFGIQEPLSRKSTSVFSRILIDLYVGVGVRYEQVDALNDTTRRLFSSATIKERFRYHSRFRPGETGWGPSLSAGFKIGVSL